MLPDQLFYNTGIFTYIWLLRNDKPASHKGRVMLMDARQQFEKEPKSFGNKRNRITHTHRGWIEERYTKGWAKAYADEQVKIFPREHFAYHKVSVVFWQTDEHDQPAAHAREGFACGVLATGERGGENAEGTRPMKKSTDTTLTITADYRQFIEELKARVTTARFGWSRNVLLNQIKAGAYERAVTEKKTHNFDLALPEHFAEQADEMLKSSYNLDFLGIRRAMKERDLEEALISRLQAFLLELGYGFCFVGRQHRIALGKKEYFIDLLFYYRFLKALVAFDLKVGPFEPEHAGKMDFYLNLLNDKERGPDDQPSIGIILCAEKDDVEVEYALRSKVNLHFKG